jgi:hypothetical protein
MVVYCLSAALNIGQSILITGRVYPASPARHRAALGGDDQVIIAAGLNNPSTVHTCLADLESLGGLGDCHLGFFSYSFLSSSGLRCVLAVFQVRHPGTNHRPL